MAGGTRTDPIRTSPDKDPEESLAQLRRKVEEYERWFRFLDGQNRVLERERQKLSAVLNHSDAGVLAFDASLKVLWTNDVFTRRFSSISGAGAVAGDSCHQVLCRLASPCEGCPVSQALRSGQVAHQEIRLELEGDPRHIYSTAMPIKSPFGDTEEALVMLQDVSDLEVLRRSQEALKASEERFRSIFENAAAGMITVGPDGRFLQVNRAACAFLGYEEDELTRMTIFDVTDPDDMDLTRTSLEQVVAGERRVVDYEKRYVRKNGEKVWGHVTSAWIFDSSGKPLYGVSLVQDITERKTAEEGRRQSEARKGAILDTALDAIISIDHRGTITEFNAAAERMFEYSREQALGREMAELIVPPSLRERHRAGLRSSVIGGEKGAAGRRIELMAMRSDRSEFPVEVAITRIPIDGPPVFTGYIRDLTERKRAEEALRASEEQLRHSQKLEAIGTLAGGVAHDFNNILTGILGQAQLLKLASSPGDRTFQTSASIEKAAKRAAELTGQLLGFARRGKNQNVPVDFHAAIAEVVALLGRTIQKSIRIVQKLRPAPTYVTGDPRQIHQVILNLALNARDAMPEGGELAIETALVEVESGESDGPEAAPGTYVLLTVSDTGCGIPHEVRDKVFDPFFTTKEQGKGTGMGLATVYGIVNNHGGSIVFASEPGRGTSFHVSLPAAEPPPSAEQNRPESAASRAGRILVVDDEEGVREVAAEFLCHLGYRVATAADGREAVEYYSRHTDEIDLVLIDMIMPRMGGRDCFRALKKINPAVRAVLSTGFGVNVAAQEILDEGMLGFVQKPYEMSQFSEVIAAALAK